MIIHLMSYDPNPSLDCIHHQTLRCILSSDQAQHLKPITCIFSLDLTLHKIFITFTPSPFIFSSLYISFLFQYLRPKPQLCCWYYLMVSIFFVVLITMGQYHGRNPWYSLTFIFHPMHSFPSMKVCAYVYSLFLL